MKLFDIFITGINPDRLNETAEIKAQAVRILQISASELDELLAQPNGVCIRRNSPEVEAKNYQHTLSKLGLICICRPSRQLSNLELVPLEDLDEASSSICPNCAHKIPVNEDDNKSAEKCEKCGITITKFLELRQKNEEREAIKLKLLASQNSIQAQAIKKQEEEAEKQRKLDLENEVWQELHGNGTIKKPPNVKLLIIGGCVIALAGAKYFLTLPISEPPIATAEKTVTETTSSSSKIAAPKGGASDNSAPMDSQQAMQKTHDQAAQVLKGFGLNPDAIADASSSGGESSTENDAAHSSDASGSGGKSLTENDIAHSPDAAKQPVASLQPLNSEEIFSVLNTDTAWDRFLSENSKTLLQRQLPENAKKLSKYIVDNDAYVDAIGELLHAAQERKQSKLVDDYLAILEARLTSLPVEQQAVYFAQAGGYLALTNNSNALLARSERLLATLLRPELQLPVILKLAVIYSKIGNLTIANGYFNRVTALLTPITDADTQVQLRTVVARAYQEINNEKASAQWLNSTEPLMVKLSPEKLSALAISYAVCNQWKNGLNIFTKFDVKEHYDLWLYQAITASLKAGFVANALELHKSLHKPVYKALSAIFIADYSPATANTLLAESEKILNAELSTAAEKSIVASRLIAHYGKIKNTKKIEALTTIIQNGLTSLPMSAEKDAILAVIVRQYLHGFQIKAANNLLTTIQSPALKTDLNVEINQLAEVGGLLK